MEEKSGEREGAGDIGSEPNASLKCCLLDSYFFKKKDMDALKPIFHAECGAINPLVQLSHFYKHDKTFVAQDGLINPSSSNFTDTNLNVSCNTSIDELVNEYHRPLAAPNAFHFKSLSTDLHLFDKHEYEWTKQFLYSLPNHVPSDSVDNQILSSVHLQQISGHEQNYIPPPTSFLLHPDPISLDQQPYVTNAGFNNDIIKATNNILSFLQESQCAANAECDTFVDHVIGVNDEKKSEIASNQREQQRDYTTDTTNLIVVNNQTPYSQSRLGQFNNRVDDYIGYNFNKINPFLDDLNPYEEGLKCLEVHDIASAVLFFEAAVQKEPDHIDAWLCLGITQSENEQDGRAICALKKCIELDSKNLQAYITLASCYANEMLINKALDSLQKWFANNDKYSDILSNYRLDLTTDNPTRLTDELTFEELKNLFLQAVSLSNIPNEIDSDLQVCLGVLFYLYDDYGKAAECFNTAVLAKPNDALLWNKLGAAVANGGHNEKAVNAYYHALTLSPGFIRARYNLGISCFNLNAYKQAIEHLLIALKQQNNGSGPQNIHAQMSENIWHTLAIAINRLQRSDLEQYVAFKNLSKLLCEFEIE